MSQLGDEPIPRWRVSHTLVVEVEAADEIEARELAAWDLDELMRRARANIRRPTYVRAERVGT